jgi:hypothetical protein
LGLVARIHLPNGSGDQPGLFAPVPISRRFRGCFVCLDFITLYQAVNGVALIFSHFFERMPDMENEQPQHGGKRSGAGRPRKYRESTRITVVVPVDLMHKLDRWAQRRGVSRSEAVVTALEKLR